MMVARHSILPENVINFAKPNLMVIQIVMKDKTHIFSLKTVIIFVPEMDAITIQMFSMLTQD